MQMKPCIFKCTFKKEIKKNCVTLKNYTCMPNPDYDKTLVLFNTCSLFFTLLYVIFTCSMALSITASDLVSQCSYYSVYWK